MSAKAKGKRPQFTDNPQTDSLVSIVMALAGEVAVLHERQDTMERLLARSGAMDATEIEAYEPDEAAQEAREAWRAAFLDRVLWIVRASLDEDAAGETPESYAEVVAALSRQ
jgi:hypothetical protein